MATAARELAYGVRDNQEQMRTTLLGLGLTSVQADLRMQEYLRSLFPRMGKPLSQDSFERIWGESEWWAKLHTRRKRRTS
jgi:hypothetical protein